MFSKNTDQPSNTPQLNVNPRNNWGQAKFISKKMTRPQAVKYEDEPKPKKNLLAQFFNKK